MFTTKEALRNLILVAFTSPREADAFVRSIPSWGQKMADHTSILRFETRQLPGGVTAHGAMGLATIEDYACDLADRLMRWGYADEFAGLLAARA